jgi:hypothetical protein
MDAGSPCPEDGDFFDARPDAEDTEEAINKFLEGLESQEEAGFDRLHSLLSKLRPSLSFPFLLPPMAAICRMLRLWRVAFCPKMDEEQQKLFMPSELLLYRHAVEYM